MGLFRVYEKDNKLLTEKLEVRDIRRAREVVESPSGEICFSTSNRDGWGIARYGDDKIYKPTTD